MALRRSACFCCALLVQLSATTARAEPAPAEALVTHGVALRRARQDAEALAEFREAYNLEPTERTLVQIALAEAALQQWAEAEADLRQALESRDEWVRRRREVLLETLNQVGTHLATLEIRGPDGAEVWIDGKKAAVLPQPAIRVLSGHHSLELKADGNVAGGREVNPESGRSLQVSFATTAAGEQPQVPTIQVEASHADAPDAVAPSDTTRAPWPVASAGAPNRGLRGITPWTVGATAALLAAGVGLNVYALDRGAHYDSDACADLPGLSRSMRCGSARSEALTSQALAFGAYGAGGLLAIATAVLFMSDRPRAAAQVWCVPAVAAATCAVSF